MRERTPLETSGEEAGGIEAASTETHGPSVLLIDGEPVLRALTSRLLSRQGARVSIARAPCSAEMQSQACSFDVVVLDLDVPGAAQLMALLAAAETSPRRLVACTSRPLTDAETEACTAVLTKPFDFDALAAAVLGRAPRHRERRRSCASGTRHTLRTRRRAARARLDPAPRSAGDRNR